MNTQSIVITPELLRLIAEIDEFRGEWKVIHTLTPERLQRLRHVATIESIGSSTRIEGVKLSNSEVEQLLTNIEERSFKTRDEQEVASYADAMETIFQSYQDIALTENYIKQLHTILLRHSHKDDRHRGQYKAVDNNVEAFDADGRSLGIIFKTASPFETPLKMQALVRWTQETLDDKSLHPLMTVGVFNVVFLAIHPFQDGNGRLSRVLSTLLLLRAGYTYVPYSSMESIIERNKEAYYLALRRTQETLSRPAPDWQPWLQFFIRTLKSQKDHLAVKMAENKGWDGLPLDSIKILDYLSQHGRITMKQAEEETQTPRGTLKLRFNGLVEKGLVVRYGKGRGTWYTLCREDKLNASVP